MMYLNHNNYRNTCSLSPSKVIISGEYSALYGGAAITVAVARYTKVYILQSSDSTNISKKLDPVINVNFINLCYKSSVRLSDLYSICSIIDERYNRFLKSELCIDMVLETDCQFCQYIIGSFLKYHNLNLECNIDIVIDSEIVMKSGMGSSASLILGVVYSLYGFFDITINKNQICNLSRKIEDLKHGISSGLDIRSIIHGGYIKIENNQIYERNSYDIIKNILIINTGMSYNTTGEAVDFVNRNFSSVEFIWQDFANVTRLIDYSIVNNNLKDLLLYLKLNHKLLVNLGVVPDKVKNFISDIEARGGAAKISGSGAIRGVGAGIVLVISNVDISDLVTKYQYRYYLSNIIVAKGVYNFTA
ncbi:mevalonate kinase family protein [Rickettsia endosymbiont of Cardiosporidium cionae]|uniref:mevalonate kinase family protein n=1 Tax=Rickettsia endosymbiont of Cardiosporidium cionae TaxID=2777155 RepID=UPI001893337D|nr:hypothetical protein [Rickettsia endosymbiont of Cardiosporidium cionae]KAF8818735.1 hypothetical protein IHI24_000461 [Rickettsia endosymbiont of Cardiosporidium cionae]